MLLTHEFLWLNAVSPWWYRLVVIGVILGFAVIVIWSARKQ